MKQSPCNSIKEGHVCSQYCKWHHQITNTLLNKTEFQTLMRYALPQSAVSMDHNDKEYQLARKSYLKTIW